MPVVALTEKGLIIDTFGENPTIMKSQDYRIANNRLVSVYGKQLRFVDLSDPKVFREQQIAGYVEMKMSRDGTKVALLGYNKELVIFRDGQEVGQHENVDVYSISNTGYALYADEKFSIYEFSKSAPLLEKEIPVKQIYCFDTYTILITKSEGKQHILMVRNGTVEQVLELENIYGTTVEVSSDETRCLLLVEVEYAKNSYYADAILYLLSVYTSPEEAKAAAVDKTDPTVLARNESFEIASFRTLKKVLYFRFVADQFYVCFGNQPAHLHLYTKDGLFLKNYKKAIRNRVLFSRNLKRIINAGLGNLPGNIEVFDDGETSCKFESLGSSIVEWLNDDTHFMVATTNYFKSDNKVKIYDYYGHAVQELECENLVRASIYGPIETPTVISPPEKKNIAQPVESYVPPHLQAGGSRPTPSPVKQRIIPTKPKKEVPVRTKEQIEDELKNCLKLRERLMSGEELSLDEQNKVFNINRLQDELSQIK